MERRLPSPSLAGKAICRPAAEIAQITTRPINPADIRFHIPVVPLALSLAPCLVIPRSRAYAADAFDAQYRTYQYTGDGNWQYNWKTPKTYSNLSQQCRVMVTTLKDGTEHRANFRFTK